MARSFGGLWERITSLENLFAAAEEAMQGKRRTGAAARYFARWEEECVRLRVALRDGTWRHGPYTYFTISDPKERVVAAATFRDRVAHHALVRVLEPLLDPTLVEDTFACRKGKGTHAAMARAREYARRYPYFLKCDIRKYFPSIPHAVLAGQLAGRVREAQVRGMIGEILASHADAEEQVWPGEDLLAVEVRRREAVLQARRAVVSTQQARRKLRVMLMEWIERLNAQITAASQASPVRGAQSGCAPSEDLAVVEVARPALDLLALGDLVARQRFIAARDAVLARAGAATATSLLVGWDRDALESFLARFWFDGVEGTMDSSFQAVTLQAPRRFLLVVDEARADFDYSTRLGRDAAATFLFLMLEVEQPGVTESTLSRGRHLLDVRFGAVCLVLQSLRAFRRADGWAADDLVEALLEADRIIQRWSGKPVGVLVNDDDIGFTALTDRLLSGPEVRTLADEQQLVAELDGLMDPTLAARVVRRWRELRQGTNGPRRTS
jgi:hypothetical protein